MTEPRIGEIRMFAGNFAPDGWRFCNGDTLLKADYLPLWDAIGYTYGGGGTSFKLPDLRSRIPIHESATHVLAESGGVESVSLTISQIPAHTHAMAAAGDKVGNKVSPAGNHPAQSFNITPYLNDAPTGSFNVAAVEPVGGSQPHDNMQPYLCINFIIAVEAVTMFPGAASDAYVAEIRIFPFNFAPAGWTTCNGQLLSISQNTALFSLLGTTYGGNGQTNFALPDLAGYAPMQPGDGPGLSLRDLGEIGGEETVTLLASEMPSHSHVLGANTLDPADTNVPSTSATFAASSGGALYQTSSDTTMAADELANVGGDLPHNNMQPYLTLTFCIALQGQFPPRA